MGKKLNNLKKYFLKIVDDVVLIVGDITEIVAHVGLLIADITLLANYLEPYIKKVERFFREFKKKRVK
ncbi:MAG: hypothetical protein ABEK36_04445 [Candidatus Aenigmatarchaeota archaeon]